MNLRLKINQFFCKHYEKLISSNIQKTESDCIYTVTAAHCLVCGKENIDFPDSLIPTMHAIEKTTKEKQFTLVTHYRTR
jgi:hypothetical protein